MKRDLLAAAAAVLCAASAAPACTVPVFRYALECWRADPYMVVLFVRGEPDAETRAVVKAVRKAAAAEPTYANVDVQVVDLNAEAAAGWKGLWKRESNERAPWMVVSYPVPRIYAQGKPVPESMVIMWSAPPSTQAVRRLVDSPKRREIARRLLQGETAVWVLLASGNAADDDRAREVIRKTSARLENTLTLPEIASYDRRYLSEAGPELKIEFSLLEVPRDDPAEAMLVRMIRGMDQETEAPKGPIAVPIFGRGRMLARLHGEFLSAEVIEEAGWFLTGHCSCQVKGLMPGVDALIAGGWDNFLGTKDLPPVLSAHLPALAGTVGDESATAGAVARNASPHQKTETGGAGDRGDNVIRNVIALLGALLLAIALATVWVRRTRREVR